jgi:hypothetical protein
MVFPPSRWNTGTRFWARKKAYDEKLAQKPETPYTKKAPRQTSKRMTSVELSAG